MANVGRRDFLISAAGAALLGSGVARAAVSAADAADTPWAGEKIVDCHFHERTTDELLMAHMDGAGVSSGLVLAFGDFAPRMPALRAKHPGRILGWGRGGKLTAGTPPGMNAEIAAPEFDMTGPMVINSQREALAILSREKRAGWKGFAETGGPVDVDGPELQRLYALAGELDVPVMMHFQQAAFNGHGGIRGFSRIEAMLKKYPRTRFVGHASDFWGHIDANYQDGGAYLTGKVNRGGLIDRLLADHANLYGDLGAPSCLLQISRDLEFTADFIQRHQHKLIFGSDCGCADGRGGFGQPAAGAAPPRPAGGDASGATAVGGRDSSWATALQMRMAAMGGLAGKCIARELLGIAWKASPRDVFRNVAWNNAMRVYKLDRA